MGLADWAGAPQSTGTVDSAGASAVAMDTEESEPAKQASFEEEVSAESTGAGESQPSQPESAGGSAMETEESEPSMQVSFEEVSAEYTCLACTTGKKVKHTCEKRREKSGRPNRSEMGESQPPQQPSAALAYQRSLLLDQSQLFRGGAALDVEDVDPRKLSQRDRNRMARGCAKCGGVLDPLSSFGAKAPTWARNGEYSGVRYHKKCRDRSFPSLRQININILGNRVPTGDTESDEEPPMTVDEEVNPTEPEETPEPPEVKDIPPGIRWNKFQSYYKGQSMGVAHEYFRKYVVYWAKKEMADAEERGEVAIIDSVLLPRGLKWAEFCTFFTAHSMEVCQARWEMYLQQAERIAQVGQPLGDNAALLVGKRVLIEDNMERGVIVKGANGFFTVSYGTHGAEVKKRGYELFLADEEDRIVNGTPSEPRAAARATARPAPKKPTGVDFADKLCKYTRNPHRNLISRDNSDRMLVMTRGPEEARCGLGAEGAGRCEEAAEGSKRRPELDRGFEGGRGQLGW